jgi:hypothetical protein
VWGAYSPNSADMMTKGKSGEFTPHSRPLARRAGSRWTACSSPSFRATHSAVAGVAAVAAALLSTFAIARKILGSVTGSRAKQLAELREELAAEVRASVALSGLP